MAAFDSINGVPVSIIETIPIRTVILDKVPYSARYDVANGVIYHVDAQGQLTGEFEMVAARTAPSDNILKEEK